MTVPRFYALADRPPSDGVIDLVAALRARWRLLAALALAGAVAAGVAGRVVPPTYESGTIIEIGRVGSLGPVETAASVVEKLRLLPVQARDGAIARVELSVRPPVGADGASGLVEVRARARVARDAQEAVRTAASDVLVRHQQVYEEIQHIRQGQLDRLTTAAAAAERALAATGTGQLATAARDGDRASRLVELGPLYQEIGRLKVDLASARSQPTRVILEATSPRPIRPNLALLVVLGAGIGLGVGAVASLVFLPPPGTTRTGPPQGDADSRPEQPQTAEPEERIRARA